MKISEIRGLSDAELVAKKQDCRQERFNLRLQQQSGSLEKSSRIGFLKLTVAKIETVLSERRLGKKVTSRVPQKAKAKN